MRRVVSKVLSFALSMLLTACSPVATPATTSSGEATTAQMSLTVFAAASLTDAFQTISKNFSTAHPGVDVVFNFAGSQQLAQQIGQGAPADLFASANASQMAVAIESGRVVSGTEQLFVRNRLVVVTPVDNPAGIATLADLAKPGLQIVLATKEVPVGQYALDFLDKAEADGTLGAGYRDAVLANVVSYEENVRTVLAKVTLGEADAGIVYRSDVTPTAAEQVQRIGIPDNLNTIASYPIAPLSDSPHAALAQQFIDYLLSPAGQQILEDAGFMPLVER